MKKGKEQSEIKTVETKTKYFLYNGKTNSIATVLVNNVSQLSHLTRWNDQFKTGSAEVDKDSKIHSVSPSTVIIPSHLKANIK